MLALVVMEHALRHRAQCGDVHGSRTTPAPSLVAAGVLPLVPARNCAGGRGHLLAFAALSASYFAHIGFFNPYLPLWLKDLGLPIFVISLLTSVQSITRVFAPYAWGALSDHTGERVKLLRFSAAVALVSSLGPVVERRAWWLALVLLRDVHAHQFDDVADRGGDGAPGGRRLGPLRPHPAVGLGRLPGHGVLRRRMVRALRHAALSGLGRRHAGHRADRDLAPARRARAGGGRTRRRREPVGPVLRVPAVRWFFASLFFHVMAHFAVYGFLSLYLDSLGYGKGTIGLLWAVSVVAEIAWFFLQGRLLGRCARCRAGCCSAALRRCCGMGITAGCGQWLCGAGGGAGAARAVVRGAPHDLHRDGRRAISRAGCAGAGRRCSP